ncbi:HTH-type transcriptional regulator CysL [Alicyclobacillus contaminans]|uniref:LysR family transcriptional regulator n=1 Tax=Alicyclobacillus contaminans TaxID=392016 RepID=UPI000429A172|nr:LysR family transcriptional regulator [Alicyclobacillus contaminans]GMA51691.1 HTH-type transcriptional regulator CysL [Alicyclobacillus contaminans]
MFSLLETFVHIVEQETLVKAAEVMHLSQPTVTRHLQQLEEAYGMPLFNRSGRKLLLNPAGELVYRYAKQHLALDEKLRDELNSFSDPEQGTVRLGAGLTLSIYLLPPVLAQFRAHHPHVAFQVRTGSSAETLRALREREVDVGLVTTFPEPNDDLEGVPLLRDPLRAVAAPNHPLAQRTDGATLETILAQPLVLMKRGSGLRDMVEELAANRGVALTISMETDSLESISRLVQHDAGISFLPRTLAADDVAAGRLRVIRITNASLGARTMTLVTRRDGMLPACTALFCQDIRQWLRGEMEEKEP